MAMIIISLFDQLLPTGAMLLTSQGEYPCQNGLNYDDDVNKPVCSRSCPCQDGLNNDDDVSEC
jgi:hypothetical protein